MPESASTRRSRSKGFDDTLMEDMKLVGLHDEELSMLPEGGGTCWWSSAATPRTEADAKAHDLHRRGQETQGPEGREALRRPGGGAARSGTSARRGSGRRRSSRASPTPSEGWEDSAVPPEQLGDYLRALRQLPRRTDTRARSYGHYGQGCIHARMELGLRHAEGIRTFRRFLDEASDLVLSWAARCRASMATGSRGQSCCRRCSARTWSRASESSSRSGTGLAG